MELRLVNLGKRFAHKWIYKDLNIVFDADHKYAITGPNGSGKSTLLKLLSTYMAATTGGVEYWIENQLIDSDHIYKHIAYTAPYMQLIEEYTLVELFDFHSVYRTMQLEKEEWIDLLKLDTTLNKPIKYFSSGMKQRVNIALILCAKADVYLIDEPTTNLDTQGKEWFQQLLEQFCMNGLLIIASNDASDYSICDTILNVEKLKENAVKN